MELVVECEWDPDRDETIADFKKLLHIKAPFKLLICDSSSLVEDKLQIAIDVLSKYRDHRAGEVYGIFNVRGNRAP